MYTAANKRSAFLIVVITICAGILPVALLAWRQGTLLLTARVDGPLLAVPSVWIGDLLFIPAFNVFALRFLDSESAGARNWRPWVFSFMLAFCVAGYSHFVWTQDAFLGFIDPLPGKLSAAGWWHLLFTIVEMTLIFCFVWRWLRAARSADRRLLHQGMVAWRVFGLYTTLSIADFIVLHEYLLPRHGFSNSPWWTAWEGLMVMPFWAAAYSMVRLNSHRASDASTEPVIRPSRA